MQTINKITPFFLGWSETLIWSCLQGCMGNFITDNANNPTAALIVVGDFCFCGGTPNNALVAKAAAPIIIPRNEEWEKSIESVWGNNVEKTLRYAFKKEANIFDLEKLTQYTKSLKEGYHLKLIDEKIYHDIMHDNWSKDLCSQFKDYSDYNKRGLGIAVVYQDKLVCGASSYTVYNGGIEIEIDTKQEFRRKGLATACAAKLIIECLERKLYPSWDAHDLRSVALAEKLGYHMDNPYTVYIKK
ncbi:GNAT acetyltransferase-like protein [Lachnotalea glycerini]|nr:GNAT acetyltransferase-like protein [Lachnotalea glycerini]